MERRAIDTNQAVREMIKGFGIDIVDIDRIDGLVKKYGSRFVTKVFTEGEILYCSETACPAVHYAGRWAAKEAFYKALPLFCQPFSTWKSIEIRSSGHGTAPFVSVSSEELKERVAACGITEMRVSISHERRFCIASVILQ